MLQLGGMLQLGSLVTETEATKEAQARLTQCPYCLGRFPDAEMTDDHVIARSWFPTKTPPVPKWKVRACGACNNKKSGLERDVHGRLAMCLNPGDPSLAGIIEKARRSMDPRSAKDARDIMHRFNRRQAIFRSVIDIQSKDAPGVLPYFSGNFDAGSRTGIGMSPQVLDGLVEMWVRGIHRCEIGSIIPAGYGVSVFHADEETRAKALSEVIGKGNVIQKGPGVEVTIYHAEELDEFAAFYVFDIRKTLKCAASVVRAA